MDSVDVADVERLWTQYVPSARAQRIDSERFQFRWRSAQTDGLGVVRYALTATVYSIVRPEDQILACRVATDVGWVRGREPTWAPLCRGRPTGCRWRRSGRRPPMSRRGGLGTNAVEDERRDVLHALAAGGDDSRIEAPVVRRAIAHMDAHAHEPITIDEFAVAAHISTRGLQYTFRRTPALSQR